MPLNVPKIDDRSYQEFLSEALARIRVHTPEWTNFNESDPGVTLLELFAFMNDTLLYRANRIPERNRVKFLKLLGVPMQPAAPARGIVTFQNERGPLETVTLSPELELKAGNLPFSTEGGLDVLPVEARVYYKQEEQGVADTAASRELYDRLYRSFQAPDAELRIYRTTPLEPPVDPATIGAVDLSQTLDGSLWIALLARAQDKDRMETVRAKIGGKILNLGILPALTAFSRTLAPVRQATTRAQSPLVFEIATDQLSEKEPKYSRLAARVDVDVLTEPGIVSITLPKAEQLQIWKLTEPLQAGTGNYPPTLEDTNEEARVLTWIRIRLAENERSAGVSARIAWVGANAVTATQRTNVPIEIVGQGTGEPDQVYTLVNQPVLPGTVRLTVGGEPWREVDDLLSADSEVPVRGRRTAPGPSFFPGGESAAAGTVGPENVKVFTVDRESGEIRFGDGIHGARPPVGARIQAAYAYGGGRAGNVGIGAVNKGPLLPAGLAVTNPVPTWGGDEAETVAEAERNISRYLRHRDRLVTKQDFEEIVRRTPGVDLGRAEVLPLFHPKGTEGHAGLVTVMVIPKYDVVYSEAPRPDRLFLDLVCRHLDARRLVTTEIHVVGPCYVPVFVSVGIEVVPGRDFPPIREAVNAAVRKFLSPLEGGREGTGWPLNKALLQKELWAEVARVDGVLYVKELLLGQGDGEAVEMVPLTGLHLPWLKGVETQPDAAQALDQVRGKPATAPPVGEGKRIVPVPVIPTSC